MIMRSLMEDAKRIQVTVDGGLWKRLAHEAADAGVSMPDLVRLKLAGPVQKPKPGGVVEVKGKPVVVDGGGRVQHSAYTSK